MRRPVGKPDALDRQIEAAGLLIQEFITNSVVADAPVVLGYRRQQAHHLETRILLQDVKRQRTVLAAAPRETHFLRGPHLSSRGRMLTAVGR